MNTPSNMRDYYCPFCNATLFRGYVNEFRMVCQECNRLVDSAQLGENATKLSGGTDQGEDFSELAE